MSHAIDRIGVVERRGVEFIPAGERTGRKRDVALVLAGMQWTYGSVLTGALPLAFGLGVGASIAAIVLGSLLGSLLVAAMAPIGSASGTNVTVSSIAAFGIRGRFLGSTVTQTVDLGYFALSLVLAVPAVDEALRLMFGIRSGVGTTVAVMAVTAALTIGLGLFGHATVVAAQKLNIVLGIGGIAVIGFGALHHPAGPARFPTGLAIGPFVLATTLMFANAVSYAPYVGDASRYLPHRAGTPGLFLAALAGMLGGALGSLGLGLLIGSAVPDAGDVLRGMVDLVPHALVAPVVVLGVLGNVGTGAIIVYNGMLDLHAVLWRFRRLSVGLVFSSLGVAIAFPALLVLDLARSIEAMCNLVGALVTPWIAVMIVDHLRARVPLMPVALQAFRRPGVERGSPYWYAGGVNPRAVFAWAAGAATGLLTQALSPLDVSVPVSAIVSAGVFAAFG